MYGHILGCESVLTKQFEPQTEFFVQYILMFFFLNITFCVAATSGDTSVQKISSNSQLENTLSLFRYTCTNSFPKRR